MEFFIWLVDNFGAFFGLVFLGYVYLIIRRIVALYGMLRHVPGGEGATVMPVGAAPALSFVEPLLARLSCTRAAARQNALIDALWAEVDCRITVHFTALNGYINTLVLVGFAGTIFGSIGAFSQMFSGISENRQAAVVFAEAWNNGLGTALYTSLGAAVIGGALVSILSSRLLLTRAKRLESMLCLRVEELQIEEDGDVA